MNSGILAALTVLLIDAAPTVAELPLQDPAPEVCAAAPAETCFWASGDCLLWWLKSGRVPPLVTVGGNGVPGQPGTRILVDSLDFVDDFRPGGRFALGYQGSSGLGIEGSYFFLADGQAEETFASAGDPVLARPYINAVTGAVAVTRISLPGIAAGSVTLGASTFLTGADANVTARILPSERWRLTALAGFRFLSLEDDLSITERFRFAGSTVFLQDAFRTANRFYGGQLGLAAETRLGRFTLDGRCKLGLGSMQQVAHINGVTDALGPTGTRNVFEGGLLALRSNIGRHEQSKLAFLPEVNLNLGLDVTQHCRLTAGYSFLWVSTVARAGAQIDPIVNESQFPILSGNGPLVGPARPAFQFRDTDFWAQGINLGLEFRY